jgi:hypothetical protein
MCSDFLPLRVATVAEKLAAVGYQNHFVGKGHLGYQTMDHLPINRGFVSHVGCVSIPPCFIRSGFSFGLWLLPFNASEPNQTVLGLFAHLRRTALLGRTTLHRGLLLLWLDNPLWPLSSQLALALCQFLCLVQWPLSASHARTRSLLARVFLHSQRVSLATAPTS